MEGLIGDIPWALVIDLNSLDWYRWMTAMLDLEAHPHSSIPYIHIGLALFYTGCPRRNVPEIGRVFLMLKYIDITQNTYVQS